MAPDYPSDNKSDLLDAPSHSGAQQGMSTKLSVLRWERTQRILLGDRQLIRVSGAELLFTGYSNLRARLLPPTERLARGRLTAVFADRSRRGDGVAGPELDWPAALNGSALPAAGRRQRTRWTCCRACIGGPADARHQLPDARVQCRATRLWARRAGDGAAGGLQPAATRARGPGAREGLVATQDPTCIFD